ncbi:plasmid replication protein, CyRepA1 family [Endozoicomonas lisbonensis]|uniref:Nitrogen regulatory protein PII-like uncharacterized protein/energy-coupling factor transporter ATP-binding protein EcfA2 n=1 Tax=Endozoicomonas lisbonensis TaxID=3120522 RepID=A0ABV2SNN5_9GAMM
MNKLSVDQVDPTGYLQEKKLGFELLASLVGLRRSQDWWYGDCIEYPLVNVKGQITGCERIYPRGLLHQKSPGRFVPKDNKKVTKGTRVSESFALVGISLPELPHYFGRLRIVGGMADAVNVYLATGEPVVCIVGENNARSIAAQLTQEWPHLAGKLIVALDHDLPGIMACHWAGFRWVVPQRYGEDWSDARLDAELQGLKRQLQWVRKPVQAIDLKSVPAPAVEMAKDNFCGDYQSALKLLTKANNEQCAATLAKAIVSRFHHKVPAQCDEHDFIQRIQAANPYLLHPDTLNQLKRQLSGYCFRQQQIIQSECGLSSGKKKSLGEHYHSVSELNPKAVSLEKGQIILIKAPYASGKTKLMSALSIAALQKHERVLTITHLVSLAHELARRLGLDSYLDIPESFMATVDRLVTCINSLCAPNVSRFLESGKTDILLLDEFSQHISVLGTSPHIKDPSVLARYLDLIEQTPTVVICDADLSSYHVGLLQEWFPERDIQFYEMPYSKNVTFNCQFAVGKAQAKSVIDHQLLPSIARGKKIAIATDSRVYAGKLEKIIRKQFPDISMLLFHGKNRNEPEQMAFQKHFDQEAQRYQVIIYTPAIESGVSIQAPFDQVFGFSHNVVLPTKFVQMLRRFRSVEQFTVVADLIPGKKDNEDWLARVRALQYAERYVCNTDGVSVGEYDGFCEAERSRQVKLRALGGNGLFYLMQNRGFSMEYYQGKEQSESFELRWKATEEEVEKEERAAIQQSPIVSESQYEELSHKVEPRLQEICSCERYRICEELGIKPLALKEQDIEFWQKVGLTRLRRFMQFPLPGGSHYLPQPDQEGAAICHRRFESIGVEVYRELLKPLFSNWDYQQSWGEQEAGQVVDRVEAYHNEYPFMLNQLRLIPDSVIMNTPQGAKFQRPKSACNFVNRLLRMAGLVINSQQIRTGEIITETNKEKRVRRYSINQESLTCMRGYAQSRSAYKQIALSHAAADSINIKQGVTAYEHELEVTAGRTLHIATEPRQPAKTDYPDILNTPSGNMEKSIINSQYQPEIT